MALLAPRHAMACGPCCASGVQMYTASVLPSRSTSASQARPEERVNGGSTSKLWRTGYLRSSAVM